MAKLGHLEQRAAASLFHVIAVGCNRENVHWFGFGHSLLQAPMLHDDVFTNNEAMINHFSQLWQHTINVLLVIHENDE